MSTFKKELKLDDLTYCRDFEKMSNEKIEEHKKEVNHLLIMMYYDLRDWLIHNPNYSTGNINFKLDGKFDNGNISHTLSIYFYNKLISKIERDDFDYDLPKYRKYIGWTTIYNPNKYKNGYEFFLKNRNEFRNTYSNPSILEFHYSEGWKFIPSIINEIKRKEEKELFIKNKEKEIKHRNSLLKSVTDWCN